MTMPSNDTYMGPYFVQSHIQSESHIRTYLLDFYIDIITQRYKMTFKIKGITFVKKKYFFFLFFVLFETTFSDTKVRHIVINYINNNRNKG